MTGDSRDAAVTKRAAAEPPRRTKAANSPSPTDAAAGSSADAATQPDSALRPAPVQGLEIYLLRHADAGDPMQWPGDDADRPLSKKGRRQAKRLGDLLEAIRLRPDAIMSSPKLRALDTAKVVGRRVGAEATVDQRLAGGFDGGDLEALIGGLDPGASRLVIVGHDPDFSELLSWLVGSSLELRKGALARVDLPDREVGPGRGLLRWLLPPDAIPG